MSDEITRLVRRAKHAASFPRDATCAFCGEHRVMALVRGRKPIRCYQCQNRRTGRSATEGHHIGGRNNTAVEVSIPANTHRTLSDMQVDAGRDTLHNPNNDPTVARDAVVKSLNDVCRLALTERLEHDDPVYNALLEGHRAVLGERLWEHP